MALSTLGTSLGASACFDVSRTEVSTSLLLDNFEDGDQVSLSDRFLPWHCYSFQSDAAQPSCHGVAPGFDSNGAEAFSFELIAPLDATQVNDVGAGLGLFGVSPLPFDLSTWHLLRFDAKFEPSAPNSVGSDILAVRLKCPGAGAPGSALDPNLVFAEQHLELSRDWASFATPLSDFQQPPFIVTGIHVPDCLEQVRDIVFEISLVDDRSGAVAGESGTLVLDNLLLE